MKIINIEYIPYVQQKSRENNYMRLCSLDTTKKSVNLEDKATETIQMKS